MANDEHVAILKQGVGVWNQWRRDNTNIIPELSGINLSKAYLEEVNFSRAILSVADLSNANLSEANLSEANLHGAGLVQSYLMGTDFRNADLSNAHLNEANLSEAHLSEANLTQANLYKAYFYKANLSDTFLRYAHLDETDFSEADLSYAVMDNSFIERASFIGANLNYANLSDSSLRGANFQYANLANSRLTGADLSQTILIETNFEHADITGCRIYGIAAWNLKTTNLTQSNLIITQSDEPEITVDNLEIAQFVYLLLNNSKLRSVIDTLTTKSVLILGRFTDERKSILDAIRDELRKHDYIPMLFDFDKPANRDLTETVKTLAGLSRFVILDLSDPNSSPHEIMSFAEQLLSVPVQGIFCPTEAHPNPYPMYEHIRRYPHVLPIFRYDTPEHLLGVLEEKVIKPAEAKVIEMRPPQNPVL